jgi:hypothetical protein
MKQNDAELFSEFEYYYWLKLIPTAFWYIKIPLMADLR